MPGKPVHIEIPAQDTARAQSFYGGMFGWQFAPMEGPFEYHMAQIDESAGGAVFPGDTGALRVYFDVEDIRAAADRVRELGGSADEPQPVPGMGWFVTGADTEGNPIGLWQTDSSAPMPEGMGA